MRLKKTTVNASGMKAVFISAEEALPLRSTQLREGAELAKCRFDLDHAEGAFHLGIRGSSGELVCILSCMPHSHPSFQGTGYQLRGMATHPSFLGQGLGKQLISFCLNHLKEINCNYLWCNARKVAYPFYEKQGFNFLSDEFEIQNIGPHREMGLRL